MCVALYIKPNEMPTEQQISSACQVNSDGWGIVVPDRGKLTVAKYFNDKGNKPNEVMKALEDAKELPRYVHLRFATAGSRKQDNCHPFLAYEEDDDYQVYFMHNGTLSDFKPTKDEDFTDSENFARKIVNPLIERVRTFTDDPLNDSFVKTILEKYSGYGSKFLLVDSDGRHLIHGTSDSAWHDWGWSSNTYSFDRGHRTTTYTPSSGGQRTYTGWTPTTTTAATTTSGTASSSATKSSPEPHTSRIEGIEKTDPEREETFTKMVGLADILDVTELSKEDLLELTENEVLRWALFRELIDELYDVAVGDDADAND